MKETLSLTGKRWIVHERTMEGNIAELLATERNLIAGPLSKQPKLSEPNGFVEMGRATDRIRDAQKKNETIAIFGDYDADGITGTVELVRYFRRRGMEPVVYLPHRSNEGYGLKKESVRALAAQGVTLMITVDTGISAHDEIREAKSLGIDVIVTDHHLAQGSRPDAFAIIHPTTPTQFQNPDLTGAGVAFMLVWALEKADGNEPWEGIEEDLALAAIGTIADMGALRGENRSLVQSGLAMMRKLPTHSPLRALLGQANISPLNVKSFDVGFRIAPRINASGRMADPRIALDALLGNRDASLRIEELNAERQAITKALFDDLCASIDDDPFICIAQPDFPPGIVGLLAGKLAERFGRPALVGAVQGALCTASLRSANDIDLPKILFDETIRHYFTSVGGHAKAAGCTFPATSFPSLKERINLWMREHGITKDMLIPTMSIDGHIAQDRITMELASALASLEPFGEGNAEPRFLLSGITMAAPRAIGNEGAHLQGTVRGQRTIGFHLGHLAGILKDQPIDAVVRIMINRWKNRNDLQIVVDDVRLSEE